MAAYDEAGHVTFGLTAKLGVASSIETCRGVIMSRRPIICLKLSVGGHIAYPPSKFLAVLVDRTFPNPVLISTTCLLRRSAILRK